MKKPLKTFPLFKSVDQALTKTYDTLATSGVKVASYGVQTAASSSTDKLSRNDRITEAVWVFEVVRMTLSDVQLACVTCTYEGIDDARAEALDKLTAAHSNFCRNRDVIREAFIREFDFGETYCKTLIVVAKNCECSLRTVETAVNKARAAIKAIRREIDDALRPEFEMRGWLRAREAA